MTVPNGKYRVTVYAIAWHDEPDATNQQGQANNDALPCYVAIFEAVENLDNIEISPSLPELALKAPDVIFRKTPYTQVYKDTWKKDCVVVIRSQTFLLGALKNFSITEAEYYALRTADEYLTGADTTSRVLLGSFRNLLTKALTKVGVPTSFTSYFSNISDRHFLFTPMVEKGAIAALFYCSGYGYSSIREFHISGYVARIVRLTHILEKHGLCLANFTPYNPPVQAADLAQVQVLKQGFADYTQTNPAYTQQVQYPHFHAERVAALTNPTEVGWAIAHALNLPGEIQYELLTLSEAQLIEQLCQALDDYSSDRPRSSG